MRRDRLGLAARVAANVGALLPLGVLLFVVAADRLSANPIEDVTRRLGTDALLMLTLSLAVTPAVALITRTNPYVGRLSRVTPRGEAAVPTPDRSPAPGPSRRVAAAIWPLRRTFGLFAFLYAALHLFVFTVVDYGSRPSLLADAVAKKPYALAGLTTFILLIPLAVTSTATWQRRLGRAWERLHMLVYPAAGLVVLHFLWAAKVVTTNRLIWAASLAGLLLVRLPLWLLAARSAGWRQRRREN